MNMKCFFTFAFVAIFASSCLPDEEERCSGGYSWNPVTGACTEGKTKKDDGVATGIDQDASAEPDSDTIILSGLGETCASQDECAGYDANVCFVVPGYVNVGFCTVTNCSSDPDDCPSGYGCCVTEENVPLPDDSPLLPSMCLTEEYYTLGRQYNMCVK